MSSKQTSTSKFSLPKPIMRAKSGTHGQFMVMVDFMERHGDLCGGLQTVQGRLSSNKKWAELTGILNSKFVKDTKSLSKWRKAWSDFKSNTRKKYEKMRLEGGELILSELEKRVLRLLAGKKKIKKSTQLLIDEEVQKIKQEFGSNLYQKTHSPASSPNPGIFCAVTETTTASRSRNNSSTSASTEASCSSSKQPTQKTKKDNINDITDRFLEFERDREKMAHEREMARIKQNNQMLSVFDRMVNVFENLAPSIQRFLDRSNSEDG